jgi:hypothetical protein
VAVMRRKVHAGFCWGNLREIDHLHGIGITARIILKCLM